MSLYTTGDLSQSALEYFVRDCKGALIIGTKATEDKLNMLTKQVSYRRLGIESVIVIIIIGMGHNQNNM